MKLRLFSINLHVNLKGANQAFYLKNSDRGMGLVKVNYRGQKSTIIETEKPAGFFLRKWYWQNRRAFVTVAISVSVFLFAGGIATFFLTRTTLEDRLYDRYYQKIDNGSLVMFNNAAFSEAKNRYEQGDAKAAWLIMENLPDKYSIQKELVLYKALTSMDMGHYHEAIQYFDTLSVMSNNKSFRSKINWYRGLCYLKTKNIIAATDAFSSITPLHPEEYSKSQRILKRLRVYSKPGNFKH